MDLTTMSQKVAEPPSPSCPKCGYSNWNDPRYSSVRNTKYPNGCLMWECRVCGFGAFTLTLDAGSSPTDT